MTTFVFIGLALYVAVGFTFSRTRAWDHSASCARAWEELVEISKEHARFRRLAYSDIPEICFRVYEAEQSRWTNLAAEQWNKIPKRMHPYYREFSKSI